MRVKRGEKSLSEFIRDDVIPQIDELQKMSRFASNQMIISNTLTKLGLQLRQALSKSPVVKKTAKYIDKI